jgi:CheY-specific phosphatase CheX
MLTQQEIQTIMDVISNRTKLFLQNQIHLDVDHTQFYQSHVTALKLRHLTSLMSLGGNVGIYLAYSFEKELIHCIFEIYTQGIGISADEQDQYEAETAGDIINIIVGNATQNLSLVGPLITLSPPITITEAKQIIQAKNAQFFTVAMITSEGVFNIFFIAPKELFDENLNYVSKE